MRRMIDTLAETSDDIYLGSQVQINVGHDGLRFDHHDDSHDRVIHDLSDSEHVHARVTSEDDLVQEPSRVLPVSIAAAHVKRNAQIYESFQV